MHSIISETWEKVVPEDARRRFYHWRHAIPRNDNRSAKRKLAGTSIPDTPLVSVVVPVYKVEEYLRPCTESILGQSYKNLEVILVDDGSPDKSGSMCDEIASKHKRVSVVHQRNGGLSVARNSGLRHATGDYVMFVDSDDILPHTAIESLVEGIGDADVATGDVQRFRGKRVWQSWNQLYSHARDTTWDDLPTAPASVPITLADAPELLFDTTAWNKLFKRSFLTNSKILFPKDKLYEDMLPMAQAFLAADSIVKVPRIVYLYREREDRSSITQKRGQIKNLADKMEMVGHIESELIAGGADSSALDTLYFKVLEGDLPVYSPYLGKNPDFDKIYIQELRKYWDLASDKAKNRLTVDRRVLFLNQLHSSNLLSGELESAWVADNMSAIPRCLIDGEVHVDVSYSPEHLGILASHDLTSAARHVELRTAVTEVFIESGNLVVRGHGFMDGLPKDVVQDVFLTFTNSEGRAVEVDAVRVESPTVNTFWSSGTVDHSNCAFEAVLPIEQLGSEYSRDDLDIDRWEARIDVVAGRYAGALTDPLFWRGGRVRLGETATISGHTIASVPWQPAGTGLAINVRRNSFIATDACLDDGLIRVRLMGPEVMESTNVVAVRVWDGHSIQMVQLSSIAEEASWFEADLMSVPKRDSAGGNANEWRLEIREPGGKSTKAIAGPGFSAGADLGEGWSTRADSECTALLFDAVTTLEVTEVVCLESGYLLRGRGALSGTELFDVHLWGDNGRKYYSCEMSLPAPGAFELAIDCTVDSDGEGTTCWLPGEYRLSLRFVDQRSCRYRLRASRQMVERCPQENLSKWFRGRWHIISDTWEMSLGILAPLADTERGRFNELEAQRRWEKISDDEIEPLDAAVFSVNMGASAGDSELAIYHELRRRNPGFVGYWAVADLSKWVPDGAIPVVKGSECWFELMNRARLVVNNYGGILGFADRPFQRYLQTWHGTPLKYIGNSEFEADARSFARSSLRAKSESRQWDWFLSPNPYMSALIPSEFYYDGPILELGYPRNDALVLAGVKESEGIREKLNIPYSARVLLYAPTFRDATASGYSSPLVSFFDIGQLARDLGDQWVVLLRGHSFNARADNTDRSSGRVLDVTDYPDVNDLMIASDVLVTDYSSIMFDYLATGKPIVHFAPDLDRYLANRGMYLEYGDVLSRPLTHTYTELVAAVQGVAHLGKKAGERPEYERQRDRFQPWDDGNAAKRVADLLCTELEFLR